MDEDEVVSKETSESIRVLETPRTVKDAVGQEFVEITGVGTRSGYGRWLHMEIKRATPGHPVASSAW